MSGSAGAADDQVEAMISEAQVLALAPDAASVGRARKTTGVSKWPVLGHSDAALWGECQGSGSKNYSVAVDRTDFSAKCSCPSRKFPCKHALGLLLIAAGEPGRLGFGTTPESVQAWLDGRRERAVKKRERAEQPTPPVDAEAAAKRAEERVNRMAAGVEELDRFLEDLVRNGLAELESRSDAWWHQRARRLVDAQVGGLARQVEALAEVPGRQPDWPARMLDRLGRLALLTEACKRLEDLPPDLAAAIRQRVGVKIKKEEVLASGERVEDHWWVLSREMSEEGRLTVARTWLHGVVSRRLALTVDFAVGVAPTGGPVAGTQIRAELAFYPGAVAERALIVAVDQTDTSPPPFRGLTEVGSFLDGVAAVLAQDPFRTQFPLVLSQARVARTSSGWALTDATGKGLVIAHSRVASLLAATGGRAASVFGLASGGVLTPMAVHADGHFSPIEAVQW